MTITEGTKISELIKANPASIEAIASINKHFQKLRNPVLRKVLASRVTIADAARIGKCTVQAFFDKLAPLGFVASNAKPGVMELESQAEPDFVRGETNLVKLDVREMLRNNQDPFNTIMADLRKLPVEGTLLLVNSFEPVPLLKILREKGFSTFVKQQGTDLFHTWIKKNAEQLLVDKFVATEGDLDALLRSYEGRVETIDVRGLEMPGPMVKILKTLDELGPGKVLYVHHKKIPQFLFPELQQKGYSWALKKISDSEVDLLIYK